MKKNRAYIIVLIILGTAFSCQKEVDQFIPFEIEVTEDVSLNLSKDFATLIDTLSYQIDQTSQTLITPSGTEFYLDTDLFQYEDGKDCPCAKVDIVMLELRDKKISSSIRNRPFRTTGSWFPPEPITLLLMRIIKS